MDQVSNRIHVADLLDCTLGCDSCTACVDEGCDPA